MTDLPAYLSDSAQVDSAAIEPLPGSRKIYVQGSRSDLRVPMREITVEDTPTEMGGEKNPPVVVYDTSGPYTDPAATIDLRKGLKSIRAGWIDERGDVERLPGYSSGFTRRRMKDPQLDPLRFMDERKPLRARPGHNVSQMHYARQGMVTPEMEFIAIRENMKLQEARGHGLL
ncbi:MAG: phosphomethylpyrimidine synthase ThiC, partial [Pseudomonadota bacterium]|nr:phosphomethylpyrimidine synthase ThiC [Pseudomonadota bacterium]